MNAWEELAYGHTAKWFPIKAADIIYTPDDGEPVPIRLPMNATFEEYEAFKQTLEGINYDNGYGTQYITGTVWFDVTFPVWAIRVEYDGRESWELRIEPEIPADLIRRAEEE